jgi:hypothetical protein
MATPFARFPKCPFVDLAKSKMAALAPPASSFDGVWVAKNVCRATPELPGWTIEFVATVKNSLFHGERGSPGKPGSESFDGSLNQDGSAELTQRGLTGATEKDPFRRPVGTAFTSTYLGSFEMSRGAFIRSNRPSCTIEFTKQEHAPPSMRRIQRDLMDFG